MPTGYTASIKDGISFEKFIMDCARAFVSCIMMRDDPAGTEIPDEFKPTDYHTNKLIEYQDEMKVVNAMNIEEANKKAKKEYDEEVEENRKKIEEILELREKYNSMLRQVHDWRPPTSDHYELKNFMIEQIESSVNFDCNTEYYSRPVALLTGEEWLKQKKKQLKKVIACHTNENEEEINRVNSRNKWIKDLRESIH